MSRYCTRRFVIIIRKNKKNLRVAHQARPEDKDRVIKLYSEHNIDAEVSSFFDDVPRRISEAQLVISRSGASSIADIATIGRPSILVPLKSARRDEQSINAEYDKYKFGNQFCGR